MSMEQFDINAVIEHYKLNTEELARVLFPTVKYPNQAFSRVLRGEALLDSEQLTKLASFAGVVIYDLFSVGTWKGTIEDRCLTFLRQNYKVKLNYGSSFISIYNKEELICQQISCVSAMAVSEFINYIDNIIKNYEDGISN